MEFADILSKYWKVNEKFNEIFSLDCSSSTFASTEVKCKEFARTTSNTSIQLPEKI
jgi:hypothetical protein